MGQGLGRDLRAPRALGAALIATCLLWSCGDSPAGPTPDMPSVVVATGPQVLRITYQGPCAAVESRAIVPIVYTRVTITRTASEWVGTASSPAAGDLELRFQPTGASSLTGSMPIQGSIRGLAIHAPDILPSLPAVETRVNFGTDGRTTLSGFAFGVTAVTPAAGVGGVGTGTVSISNGAGDTCAGSAFSWGLGPPG